MGFGSFTLSALSRIAFILGGLVVCIIGGWTGQFIGYWCVIFIIFGMLLAAYGVCKKSRKY